MKYRAEMKLEQDLGNNEVKSFGVMNALESNTMAGLFIALSHIVDLNEFRFTEQGTLICVIGDNCYTITFEGSNPRMIQDSLLNKKLHLV